MHDADSIAEGRRRERAVIVSWMRIEAYQRTTQPGNDPAYIEWLRHLASQIATGAYSR